MEAQQMRRTFGKAKTGNYMPFDNHLAASAVTQLAGTRFPTIQIAPFPLLQELNLFESRQCRPNQQRTKATVC
ncbi:unnamed protein product [Pieris brassicae]|uniref:Uncharacterized protein n=1 Tax=Pieris brassicae TaxID=7116 RepID=A0A9P0TUC4_PIEBR|nr:unnamed protein product [Pieris brassicae]